MARYRITKQADGRVLRRYRDTNRGALSQALAFREAGAAKVSIEERNPDNCWASICISTLDGAQDDEANPICAPGQVLTAKEEWFWEGNVQERFCQWLVRQGWTILQAVDTASKQRGTDIIARCSEVMAHLEVKGFPSTRYADSRRQGEQKRTNPRLQAKHWFAHALFKVCQLRNTYPDHKVGLVYPDYQQLYRTYAESVSATLSNMQIELFLVSQDGEVEAWHGLS